MLCDLSLSLTGVCVCVCVCVNHCLHGPPDGSTVHFRKFIKASILSVVNSSPSCHIIGTVNVYLQPCISSSTLTLFHWMPSKLLDLLSIHRSIHYAASRLPDILLVHIIYFNKEPDHSWIHACLG